MTQPKSPPPDASCEAKSVSDEAWSDIFFGTESKPRRPQWVLPQAKDEVLAAPRHVDNDKLPTHSLDAMLPETEKGRTIGEQPHVARCIFRGELERVSGAENNPTSEETLKRHSPLDGSPARTDAFELEDISRPARELLHPDNVRTSVSPTAACPFRTVRVIEFQSAKRWYQREILLTTGEKLSGVIASESATDITLDHPLLGKILVPKKRAARRPIEIFLRNGDRLVGELVSESPEAVRMEHSGLGLLTIPRSEICKKVASFELVNGDRVCGEVIEETSLFIRLRSDSLGTILIPRKRIRDVLSRTF